MELSVKEFLDSVTNPNTKKEYKHGINKFVEWYKKTAEEILQERKNDLTQEPNENLIEYKNRASRFEKELEKFHAYLLTKYSINTARTVTLGIRQLFRFYEMGIRFRTGSKIGKTVLTNKNFPLTIEHVRRMFAVGDLRERIILSMATDLGLRINDFINLKKSDLPPLDQEPPISFDIMTGKENVIADGFLSKETTELLKVYLPTLEKKKENPYLFPSNGNFHISGEWLNRLLSRLAEKAKINLGNKKFTFHCFRKMLLSTAIDSGIGLIAGKKIVGKSIAKSDNTYLTTVKLREKFIQLKKFLTITEQPQIEKESMEPLKKAINKLQEDLTVQKTVTKAITEKNLRIIKDYEQIKKQIEKLLPEPERYQMSEEEAKYMEELSKQSLEESKNKKSLLETDEERRIREEHTPPAWYLDKQYKEHLELELKKDKDRIYRLEEQLKKILEKEIT